MPLPKLSYDNTTLIGDSGWAPGRQAFKRVDNGSELMNINGLAEGTSTIIWDGDGTYWTPEGVGSAQTYAKYSGTYGWDTGVTSKNQVTGFDYGSDQDITQYDTISFWIQPKAYPSGSILQLYWETNSDVLEGNILEVDDYISNMDLDVWQQVTVPIVDFGLGSNVAKIVLKYTSKGSQQFWFDDIKLSTSGVGEGPFIFCANAPVGYTYHMSMMVLLIAGSASGWEHDVFGSLSSALDNGLLLRQRKLSTSEVLWSLNAKENIELFGFYHPQDVVTFADSVMMLGFMVKPSKDAVLITDDAVLEYVVRDDLSALDKARAFVHYGVEVTP